MPELEAIKKFLLEKKSTEVDDVIVEVRADADGNDAIWITLCVGPDLDLSYSRRTEIRTEIKRRLRELEVELWAFISFRESTHYDTHVCAK